MTKPLSEIKTCIAQLCQSQPAIMAAYLFGSVATGQARQDSDIDIAVLLAT